MKKKNQINSQHVETSKVVVTDKMPSREELEAASGARNLVVVYDERLNDEPFFSAWLANFSNKIGVQAGESLKSIDNLPGFARSLLPMFSGFSAQECALIAVGGGSVGDFVGFLASVIKRGVTLVQIPTTWLSAIDSAYGGKTALNVGFEKNQIGTFYSARAVFCVDQVLTLQPKDNLKSGYGEALKMALLTGGPLYKKMASAEKLDVSLLWKLLPNLVTAKMKIVTKDPFERRGLRAMLNLGHTLGHSIEIEQNLAHGLAIQLGTEFSVRWSFARKILKKSDHDQMIKLLEKNPIGKVGKLPRASLAMRLAHDKKSTAGKSVRFVFIKKPGKPVIEEVAIADILVAADMMGWLE